MRSGSRSILIRNGLVVTSSDECLADVHIVGEKIQAIGSNLNPAVDQVLDASGCYVIPGGIDAHTHMELPFMGTASSDTFESGTIAGLHGGTTTIIDFAIQTQGDSLHHALSRWHEKAAGNAACDYAFHLAVTDFRDNFRTEIQDLVEKQGVTSFKTFMAYKGALMVDDRQILDLMREAKKYGALVTSHAENGDLVAQTVQQFLDEGMKAPEYHPKSRPPICEAEATGRILDLAYSGNHPLYIVHMTCEDALNRVRLATLRNQKVFVETCVQYLLLDESRYLEEDFGGAKYVMSPPLRTLRDQEALWKGIDQGLIQVVATDHCPFCMDQKRMGTDDFSKIPNGAPGIENRVELLYSEGVEKGRISLQQWVDLIATQPSKIFGLFPRKGTISVGSDADLVIFDPRVEHTISAQTHHMNCDYNLYEGWQVRGKCRTTLMRGRVAVDQGQFLLEKGYGKYLSRTGKRSGGIHVANH